VTDTSARTWTGNARTPTPVQTPTPVTVGEIADLLALARSLSQQGPHADPEERAIYQVAKAELLARITDQHPHRTAAEGGGL
jgi:hypothetical protein